MFCLSVVVALEGISDVVNSRIGKKSIGFNGKSYEKKEEKEAYKMVTHEDIKKYGIIPELVGRLPVIASLEMLEVKDLVKILKEPKNAILRQYQKMFKMDGVTFRI